MLSLLDSTPVVWMPNMTTQSKSEQLRIRAHECEVKAEATHDPDIRRLYRDMAAQWRQMARQHDELGLYDDRRDTADGSPPSGPDPHRVRATPLKLRPAAQAFGAAKQRNREHGVPLRGKPTRARCKRRTMTSTH